MTDEIKLAQDQAAAMEKLLQPDVPKKTRVRKSVEIKEVAKNSCNCGCVHSDPVNQTALEVKSPIEAPHIKPVERFDREKEMSLVKGIFHYHEQKGKTLKWYDRFPWRGAKMKKYVATDKQIVELPYYVARRLMEKGEVPVISEVKDANGKPVQKITSYNRRFDFFPLNTIMPAPSRPRLIRVHKL